MFHRMIEDFKDSTGTALRMSSLAAAAGLALFVAGCFVCAAVFVAVLQKYGPIEACMTVAGIFLVSALIVAAIYVSKKRQARARLMAEAAAAREAAKSSASSILADPMLLAAGLQIVRAVGVKKLIPLLAIAGVAAGIFMSRNSNAADTDEEVTEE
jgi:protein-S-isoprenylcysteine O-methyltransferase Ste14